MKAYLLTWNPKYYPWDRLNRELNLEQKVIWRCASKQPKPGDAFFISALGQSPQKGIFAAGIVEVLQEDAIDDIDPSRIVNYLCGNVTAWLNIEEQDILNISELEAKFPDQTWNPMSSGIEIKGEYVEDLKKM